MSHRLKTGRSSPNVAGVHEGASVDSLTPLLGEITAGHLQLYPTCWIFPESSRCHNLHSTESDCSEKQESYPPKDSPYNDNKILGNSFTSTLNLDQRRYENKSYQGSSQTQKALEILDRWHVTPSPGPQLVKTESKQQSETGRVEGSHVRVNQYPCDTLCSLYNTKFLQLLW